MAVWWKSYIGEWSGKKMHGAPIAVIDFETTGLDTQECSAVSVAVVHMNLGMNNAELVYDQLINPHVPIPKVTTKIHGITNEKVADMPSFEDQLPVLLGHLDGRLLAAYNLPYDWAMLNTELSRCGEQRFPLYGICGKVLAMYVDNQKQGRGYHRLVNVAGRRGLAYDAHNAAADAMVTAQVIDMMLPSAALQWRKQTRNLGMFGSVREYMSFQKQIALEKERQLRLYYMSQGSARNDWPWTDY
jgi:DNA polymerase-3 subunit epsilon|tara:strand:- start:1055 stop:1786 length:732 start_codon:yes stop_codon:yes gene_type:complete